MPSLTPKFCSNDLSMQTGFYDVEKKQYWLPCACDYDGNGLREIAYSDAEDKPVMCPGYIFNDTFTEVMGEYMAYHSSLGGFLAPVRTDIGIQTCAVNTSTLYYPKTSQVMSGVVFDETFEKLSEHVLRIIYRYQLS